MFIGTACQIGMLFNFALPKEAESARIGSEDNPLSDSIMDRIKYDAYKISIKAIDAKHDKSMREVYGLKASESH